MRCPKCSFISFDDLTVCAKCAGDLSALAKELNGTCIEARPEFFLGTALQTPSLDDDSLSDSQVLPPLDHAGINFDDTTTGGFAPLAASSSAGADFSDFDDSIGVATEDDVAIELGDIMPIDLDQLDDASVFAGESLVQTNSFDTGDFALDLDKTETITPPDENAVDLDLTGKFSSQNAELDLEGVFSDIEIDDSTLDFANDTLISKPAAPATATPGEFAETPDDLTPFDSSGGINLDDELIAQLVSFNDDLDSADSSASHPALSAINGQDVAEEASLDLDESLVAELTGAFPAASGVVADVPLAYSPDHSGSGQFELDAALVAELADDVVTDEMFSDVDLEQLSEGDDQGPVRPESATGGSVAGPVHQVSDDRAAVAGQSGGEAAASDEELLDFSDIDVSDLIVSSPEEVDAAADLGTALDFSQPLELAQPVTTEAISTGRSADLATEIPIEDLTGEFYPVVAESGGIELDDLDLGEIDVTDLLESSPEGGEEVFAPDDTLNDLAGFSFDSSTLSDTVAVGGELPEQVSSVEAAPPAPVATPQVESEGDDDLAALSLDVEADSELLSLFPDSVDDTLQETVSGEGAAPATGSPEQLGGDAAAEELFAEIDLSELAAELKNGAAGLEGKERIDALPEIELIPDGEDGDEGPPDLPK